MPKIKNIIYDFDGTIADTFGTIVKILNDNREKIGIDGITSEEAEKFRDFSIPYLMKEFNIHLFNLPKIITFVKTELGRRMGEIPIFTGMPEVFENIHRRGLTQGIVTGNYVKNVTDLLTDEQEKYFSFIKAESDIFGKHRKLAKVLKAYDLNPDETIYVGDEVRDIQAAHKVGIRVMSVTWGFNSRKLLEERRPDYLVDNPSRILFLLDSIS